MDTWDTRSVLASATGRWVLRQHECVRVNDSYGVEWNLRFEVDAVRALAVATSELGGVPNPPPESFVMPLPPLLIPFGQVSIAVTAEGHETLPAEPHGDESKRIASVTLPFSLLKANSTWEVDLTAAALHRNGSGNPTKVLAARTPFGPWASTESTGLELSPKTAFPGAHARFRTDIAFAAAAASQRVSEVARHLQNQRPDAPLVPDTQDEVLEIGSSISELRQATEQVCTSYLATLKRAGTQCSCPDSDLGALSRDINNTYLRDLSQAKEALAPLELSVSSAAHGSTTEVLGRLAEARKPLADVERALQRLAVTIHPCQSSTFETLPLRNGGLSEVCIPFGTTPAEVGHNAPAVTVAMALTVGLLVAVGIRLTDIAGQTPPDSSTLASEASAIVGLLAILPVFLLSRFTSVRESANQSALPRRVRVTTASVAVLPIIPCLGVVGSLNRWTVAGTQGYAAGYLALACALPGLALLIYNAVALSSSGVQRQSRRALRKVSSS